MHHQFSKKIRFILTLFLVSTSLSIIAQNINNNKESSPDRKIGIIFDADFASDPQDVGALGMLFSLSNLQRVEILGIMCGTNNRWSVLAISSLTKYYGHPEIPIGVLKDGYFTGDSEFKSGYSFNIYLAKNYPHLIKNRDLVENSTSVLRKILSRSENKSIHYICTGNLLNLQNLLNSKPDSISPLFGYQLIKKKVSLLTLTIGGFPKYSQEYHLLCSLDASQNIASTWPSPVLYIGHELDKVCKTGPELMRLTNPRNPVRASYLNWDKNNYSSLDPHYKSDYIHSHSSFAPLAVYFSILGENPNFHLSQPGAAFIDNQGTARWILNHGRIDHYLIAKNNNQKLAYQLEKWMAYNPKR